MITIIFPYRNREIQRIKISLDSLVSQINTNFKVLFVDYGSTTSNSQKVEELLRNYSFVTYVYSYHEFQPWSRAKAINIGLRLVKTEYIFVADIDMIFRNNFVEKLNELKKPYQSIFFKVGFLNKNESQKMKDFQNYKISHSSQKGAQGLSLFPIEALKKVNGFDEFLHFWGAEDQDIHERLQNLGQEVIFFQEEILLLHQWHPTYRGKEQRGITKELRISKITQLNQEHFLWNKKNKIVTVNDFEWGKIISKTAFEVLQNPTKNLTLTNRKEIIEHFLFVELPNFKNGILTVTIVEDAFHNSLKYTLKKMFRKKVPHYYTLKEINDLLLLHIISFYRNYNYIYRVSDDLKSIEFKIQKA